MKRAAEGSPVRSASPRYEGEEQPQQERGPTEQGLDVPSHLVEAMENMDIDLEEEEQPVRDFYEGFMPKSDDDASDVAEWCAEQGLADHFVHVVTATKVPKVWIGANLGIVTNNLAKCPTLERLVLGGDAIGDQQVVDLLNALKDNSTLREFFLSRCPRVTEDTLKLLAKTLLGNPGLLHVGVQVSRHPTGWINDLATTLTERPYPLLALTLEDVSLTSGHLKALSSAFRSNEKMRGLEMLALAHGDFPDAGPLIEIVKGQPKLKALDLSGLAPSSVNGIVKWLGEDYQGELRSLKMSRMRFATLAEKTGWITCMSAMLCSNTTLRTLDLGHNGLQGGSFSFRPDVSLLCTAIEANSALETLHLDGSNFTVAAVDQLITSLRRNVALTKVTLSGNLIEGVPTQAQLGNIRQITADNRAKLLLCTTALIEGAGAGFALNKGLPPEIGLRMGQFAAGTTAGDLDQARHLLLVSKATHKLAVERRSQAYARMLGDEMRERGGFKSITEMLRQLKEVAMTIHPEHMDELMQRAAQDGQLEDLIESIESSGFASRPSAVVQASLVAEALSMQRPKLVSALQRFGHAAVAPASVGPELAANQQVNDG